MYKRQTKNAIDMEDMFSLGNVGLWKYVTNSSWAPTGAVSYTHLEEYDSEGNKNRMLSNLLRRYKNEKFTSVIANNYMVVS